jgi:hypothetical protein
VKYIPISEQDASFSYKLTLAKISFYCGVKTYTEKNLVVINNLNQYYLGIIFVLKIGYN